jgi:2-dehydropantoate 2-reductase
MKMLREALAVMKAMKVPVVDLPGAPATRLSQGVRRLPTFLLKPILARLMDSGRGDKMPSFHMDLTAGKKKNEVVYHNGAVAAAGKRVNVPTPVNTALTDILVKMARGEIDWTVYDGNPSRLVEEVERYKESKR